MKSLSLALLVASLIGCSSSTPSSGECNYNKCDSGVENTEDSGRNSDGTFNNTNNDGNGNDLRNNNDSCSPCGYDMNNPDSGNDLEGRLDAGTPDVGVDSAVSYPIARLNCEERNDDGLCVFRTRRSRGGFWDASPSQAGPGRSLTNYRMYFGVPGDGDYWVESSIPRIGAGYNVINEDYNLPDGFPAELEVTDDLGATDRVGMRNIVSD